MIVRPAAVLTAAALLFSFPATISLAATGGTEVAGAEQRGPDAPVLEPGGYVDALDTGGTGFDDGPTKYYRVPAPGQGWLYVSAFIPDPLVDEAPGDLKVDLALQTPDGTVCREASEFILTGIDTHGVGAHLIFSGSSSTVGDCADHDVLFVALHRSGEASAEQALPVEILVRTEAAVTDPGPPLTKSDVELPEVTAGEGSPIEGGRRFLEAVELEPGRTYSDTLAQGESRYYRVRLTWGQRLSYLVRDTGPTTDPIDSRNSVSVRLCGPTWREMATFVDEPPPPGSMFDNGQQEFRGSMPIPVRFTNRDFWGFASSLDGDYFLVVTAEPSRSDDGTVARTTFQITTAVTESVEPGPTYLPTTVTGRSGTADDTTGVWWFVGGAVTILAVGGLLLARRRSALSRPGAGRT